MVFNHLLVAIIIAIIIIIIDKTNNHDIIIIYIYVDIIPFTPTFSLHIKCLCRFFCTQQEIFSSSFGHANVGATIFALALTFTQPKKETFFLRAETHFQYLDFSNFYRFMYKYTKSAIFCDRYMRFDVWWAHCTCEKCVLD